MNLLQNASEVSVSIRFLELSTSDFFLFNFKYLKENSRNTF